MDKKGQVGLGTGMKVIVAVLIMAILGFVSIIVLNSLTDSNVAATTGSGSAINETVSNVNHTAIDLNAQELPDALCTVTRARNSTDPFTEIVAGNFTITDCTIVLASGDTSEYNNTDWLITYTFTYNKVDAINSNITTGVSDFFSNAGTWFSLLAIVIIILIVVIVMRSVSSGKGGGL